MGESGLAENYRSGLPIQRSPLKTDPRAGSGEPERIIACNQFHALQAGIKHLSITESGDKTEKLMKTTIQMTFICLLIFCVGVVAQTDIAGTWEGKLEIAPGQEMRIHFIITKQGDGSYKAVLDSPDTGAIKNEPASAVAYAGGKLTVEVDSLSGSYSGTVGEGTITGEWKQPGSTLPLVLSAYKEPSSDTLKPLLGEWSGKLKVPGGDELTAVFNFDKAKDGKFSASLGIVEQGQQNIPVSDVLLKDNQVSFNVAGGQLEYTGRLNGDRLRKILRKVGD